MTDKINPSIADLRAARADSDPDVRTKFLDGLGREDRRHFLSRLDAMLGEVATGEEATDASILMAVVGGADAVPLLRRYQDSPNSNLLADLAEAFSIIGDPYHLETIEALSVNPAAREEWTAESIGVARVSIHVRAALAQGLAAWAEFENKSAVIWNSHDLKGLSAPDADFSNMYIEAADLRGATLTGASFAYSHLFRTDFCGTSLVGAEFEEADLVETCFRGADLTGATGLTRGQLSRAFTDEHTRLPRQ